VNETLWRLSFFLGIFLLCAGLEALFPRRSRVQKRGARWFTNIGLTIIDSLALRLLGPLIAVSVVLWAQARSIGLFNLTDWPLWLEFALAFALLDLAIYFQHIATHKIPLLWRLHRVHHADRDLDATSGVRFHPVEIMLSMLYKSVLVLLIGPSLIALIVFEIALNGSALFNHANLKLPLWLDKGLRLFIVTPDYHRVHHSIIPAETDSNYGFCFSVWDRLFRTYTPQPQAGHRDMTIGLPYYQSEKPANLLWSLLLPFRR